jgi:hypothetical protein
MSHFCGFLTLLDKAGGTVEQPNERSDYCWDVYL